jgi:hypothetical protein
VISYGTRAVVLIVALVAVALIALLASFAYASRHARFETGPEGLAIRGDITGRRLPLQSPAIAEALWDALRRDFS